MPERNPYVQQGAVYRPPAKVKVNVVLPPKLISALRRMSAATGVSASAILAQALAIHLREWLDPQDWMPE